MITVLVILAIVVVGSGVGFYFLKKNSPATTAKIETGVAAEAVKVQTAIKDLK